MIEQLTFNIAVDITGILGLFFMLLSFSFQSILRDQKTQRIFDMFIILIAMMACDMIACLYRGRTEAILLLYVANTATFVLSFMLVLIFFSYIRLELEYKKHEWKNLERIIYGLAILMMVSLLLNPIHRAYFMIPSDTALYQREKYYFLITLVSSAILILSMIQILLSNRISWNRRVPLLCFCLFPMIAVAIQNRVYGISLTNMAALFSCLIVFTYNYRSQHLEVAQKELELQNAHAALVLSQIQPHFLFNSMAAVMDLCDTDPREAKYALQELSDYLHFKIHAMSNSYIIPFTDDMEFVQNYLKLEKRRFGDRLQVEYRISFSDFQIPLLTMQPLVENAVRHGISKKASGGTIRITAEELDDCYHILVEDDGVGFDAENIQESTGSHVGLENVRNRLAALCGGKLSISSQVGIGTTVEITVQKGGAAHDHSRS